VFKGSPRVHLSVAIDRLSKPEAAEIFYVHFPLSRPDHDVVVTNGGLPYRPGIEQLPGSCQDFHAIDDRVVLTNGTATLAVETLDAALVEFGGIHDALRLSAPPQDPSSIYVAVFNNIWYTNFAGDENGIMEFEFDLHSPRGGVAPARFSPQAFAVVRV